MAAGRSAAPTSRTSTGARRPFYNLMMFPYPSAEGLHVGNMFAFTGADMYGRYQRLRGRTVFEPIGYDAFGIHSENYALKVGQHPGELIPRNIAQLPPPARAHRRDVRLAPHRRHHRSQVLQVDPVGLPSALQGGTGGQEEGGGQLVPQRQDRPRQRAGGGGAVRAVRRVVEQRVLEQWFFRITDYADRLLDDLDGLDWSETTRTAQRNWIGRSEGAEVDFARGAGRPSGSSPPGPTPSSAPRSWSWRPSIRWSMPSPRRPSARRSMPIAAMRSPRTSSPAAPVTRQKTGVFTGAYAVNPATGRPIPVWIADYVLMEYGTGAIMAVPGHDERDFEFATKYPAADRPRDRRRRSDGRHAPRRRRTSSPRDAWSTPASSTAWTPRRPSARSPPGSQSKGAGARKTLYRLHDWCVSRQRYWGPPIPIIYCDACGTVAGAGAGPARAPAGDRGLPSR